MHGTPELGQMDSLTISSSTVSLPVFGERKMVWLSESDLSMRRLITVRVFNCFCDNVIIPFFITYIVYQKVTLSQVNNITKRLEKAN